MIFQLLSSALRIAAASFGLWFFARVLWPRTVRYLEFKRRFRSLQDWGPNHFLGCIPLKLNGRWVAPGLWSEEKWRNFVWEGSQSVMGYIHIQPPKILKFFYITYPCVMVAEPTLVKTILASSEESFQSKAFVYRSLAQWIGDSFLTSQPAKNRVQRKLFAPAFNYQVMVDICKSMNRTATAFVNKLAKIGDCRDMVTEATELTLLTLCGTLVNHEDQATLDEIHAYRIWAHDLSKLTMERMLKPFLHPDIIYRWTRSGRQFYDMVGKARNFTRRIIDKRMAEIEKQPQQNAASKGKGFLDLYIEYYRQGVLSFDQMQDEMDTIMLAGHDTTAIALSVATYLLGRYTEHQARARQEVDALWIKYPELQKGGDLTIEMVSELEYLNSCIKETLRLYPSTPIIARQLSHDTEIDGYNLPEGVIIILNFMAMQRDPRYWSKPARYDPTRFLKENDGEAAWAQCSPFSGGARGCLGRKYAMLEIQVTLARMLRHLEWEAPEPEDKFIVDIKMVMHPRNKIHINFRSRK